MEEGISGEKLGKQISSQVRVDGFRVLFELVDALTHSDDCQSGRLECMSVNSPRLGRLHNAQIFSAQQHEKSAAGCGERFLCLVEILTQKDPNHRFKVPLRHLQVLKDLHEDIQAV